MMGFFSYEACKDFKPEEVDDSACQCKAGEECHGENAWCYIEQGVCSDASDSGYGLFSYKACKK